MRCDIAVYLKGLACRSSRTYECKLRKNLPSARESTRYKRTSISHFSPTSRGSRLHNICIERACLTEIFRTSALGARPRFIDKRFARSKKGILRRDSGFSRRPLLFAPILPAIFRDFHRERIPLPSPKLLSSLFTSFRIRDLQYRSLSCSTLFSTSTYLSSRSYVAFWASLSHKVKKIACEQER